MRITFVAAPAADRPGAARQLLRRRPSEPLDADEVRELFEAAYADEPFVELVDAPPGVRDVRDTNRCRIHATVEPATRVLAFARSTTSGRAPPGQAVQDLNLMLGLPETEGLDVSGFFRSRWVERPAHVSELEPTALPRGLPRRRRGGRASSPRGSTWACSSPTRRDTVSAARFTTNARVGAPVIVSRAGRPRRACARWSRTPAARTSATASAGSRPRGPCRRRAAEALGVEPEQVGRGLDGRDRHASCRATRLVGGRRAAAATRSADDADDFSRGDPHERQRPQARLPRGRAAGGHGAARGARPRAPGMISPRFATMFCFVQTDAALEPETLDLLTGVCVKRSFDRISVDGQLSTSDTVFALAERRLRRARSSRRPPTSCASARRWTRCCASSRSRSSPTARAPGGSGAGRARTAPTPSSRSRARSPTRRS